MYIYFDDYVLLAQAEESNATSATPSSTNGDHRGA